MMVGGSEEYVLRLTENGFPETGSGANRALFRDLSRADFLTDLYLVCRIVRVGRLLGEEGTKKKPRAKGERFFRRPYGVALCQLGPALVQRVWDHHHLLRQEAADGKAPRKDETFEPPNADIFVPNQEVDFNELHTILIDKCDRDPQHTHSHHLNHA